MSPILTGPSELEAWALFELGRRPEAAALVEETLQAHPADEGGFVTGVKALLAAASGQTSQAELVIQAAEKHKGFGHFHHTAYTIEWLRQAAADGFPCCPCLSATAAWIRSGRIPNSRSC